MEVENWFECMYNSGYYQGLCFRPYIEREGECHTIRDIIGIICVLSVHMPICVSLRVYVCVCERMRKSKRERERGSMYIVLI